MKKLILFLFLSFVYIISYAQLDINNKVKLVAEKESVINFINSNKFDYAVICWQSSNWETLSDSFSCLLKQNNKWFLAKIISPKFQLQDFYRFNIIDKKLKRKEVKSLKKEFRIDSAFFYTQEELSALPDECSYNLNGKPEGLMLVNDAATYHSIKYENSKVNSLSYYAPDVYLAKCYPYVTEYGILKGIVNLSDKISFATKKLK